MRDKRFSVLAILFISLVLGTIANVVGQEQIKPFGRRIVGGEPTTIEKHPWQVALNVAIDGDEYLCGGSIIAERWVLTAAHCFKPTTTAGEVRVKAGVTTYMIEGAWLDVERIVIYEAYNPNTHENDLALVKLLTGPSGRVIPLAKPGQVIPVGQPLEVTGWGATSEGSDASKGLLKATVPYADNAACNAPNAYNGAIKTGMMCAGYREGGTDSCQGDSGGPLVWRTADGPVLVGVVSWGEGCARKLKYGVYTRTGNYVGWIGKVVAQGGS